MVGHGIGSGFTSQDMKSISINAFGLLNKLIHLSRWMKKSVYIFLCVKKNKKEVKNFNILTS